MPRLFDFYAPIFSFGLRLDSPVPERATPTGGETQHRARRLLERARAAALGAGKPLRQIELSEFALVAWFDEIMQRHRGWAESAAPLQMQLFNSRNARTEFFHHLCGLRSEDAEVREIYWYAMAMGFQGQYDFQKHSGDGEIAKLMALHASRLPLLPLDISALRDVPLIWPRTPTGLAEPDAPQHRERKLLRAAAAIVLLAPTGVLLAALLGANKVSTPGVNERLEGELQSYACADLTATVDPQGRARLRGFVPQRQDIDQIERALGQMPGVQATDVALQLRPWPYCEVVTMLKPYQARNRRGRFRLKVSAPTARDEKLREGDPVRVRVKAPRKDAQLWVDYYTADGSVLHFRAEGAQVVQTTADQVLILGADIPASWLVGPPFGTVLIAAVAIPRGQVGFGTDAPPFEPASAYLLRLREMLSADPSGDQTLAEFVFLQTTER